MSLKPRPLDTQLIVIIAHALDEEISDININSSSDDVMAWDSLGQLSILSAIDSELQGKLGDDMMSSLASKMSVRELFEAVKEF